MKWFAYEVSPIDWGWNRLKTVEETAREIGADEALVRAGGGDPMMEEEPTIEQFLADWESAKQAAEEKGWEGDFRHKPVVFWVPTSTSFEYGFAFKQVNNGTTFVISPVRLPLP